MIIQTEVTIRLQHVSQGWFLWGEDDSGTLLSVATWKKCIRMALYFFLRNVFKRSNV